MHVITNILHLHIEMKGYKGYPLFKLIVIYHCTVFVILIKLECINYKESSCT